MKNCNRILYIGLDPSRFSYEGHLTHLPLIAPVPYRHPEVAEAFASLPHYEAVLLTSRSAVNFFFDWKPCINKIFYCVGRATALQLKAYGISPLIAKEETGEGVCALLAATPPRSLFYPHAKGARSVISQWLTREGVVHLAIPFYETLFLKPDPLPPLSEFDEIVFTSPSTIDAFIHCYGQLPANKTLTTRGPVTAKALEGRLA